MYEYLTGKEILSLAHKRLTRKARDSSNQQTQQVKLIKDLFSLDQLNQEALKELNETK